ncbi:hypothetical protein LZ578_02550 [Jeotgalibaca sp. MA1X17-3]|uniref:hypothetical protein n=1 Tax=Jeotgalibaca sp. MA1X17-3 TaxID=2908211 RepID=UPI001F2EFAEE|nr:hypothetical protein [Jeotgalibaca sp. MA1X17-3]UJF16040.1 hypothetical protein LZ578_02550 [Jeotgalibaca sp. MA1X17-3]
MELLEQTFDMKWPVLLFEFIFLLGGLVLVISGIKIRKQSGSSALLMIILGVVLILVSLYLLFMTLIFGYNS